ncbi:MAG: hypothetical protein AAFX92_12220 [Pseudomonadota bacterium]
MASTKQRSQGERTTAAFLLAAPCQMALCHQRLREPAKTILNCISWRRIVQLIFICVFEAGGLVMAWIVVGSLIIWLLAIAFAGLKLLGYVDWSWWTVTIPLWAPMLVAVLVAAVLSSIHGYRRTSRSARGFLRTAGRLLRQRVRPRDPR